MKLLRVVVGIPLFWLRVATGTISEYGILFSSVTAAGGLLALWAGHPERVLGAFQVMALPLILKLPAEWLQPRLDHALQVLWPTQTHISELPTAAKPFDRCDDLPVSVVLLDPKPYDVHERPQVLGF